MEGELLDLSRSLEEARALVKRVEEALAEETHVNPTKNQKLIEEYKESHGFQLGLQRSGQVSYEYGYRVIVSLFRARFPVLHFDVDPFLCLPEDDDVEMPKEVPFDDSADLPGA
ncbi:hypothetical protein C4D60_Mb08t21400 [Musa balbisiana]|uniref:Uncharacterized protein n=1 Tax=Musa balbisiana TaxID=52838 RepID=A0A4S8K5D6_MUSBA|nr:hypothetical protein C4D60_Mb08t21400 [Musa balbisiana]